MSVIKNKVCLLLKDPTTKLSNKLLFFPTQYLSELTIGSKPGPTCEARYRACLL